MFLARRASIAAASIVIAGFAALIRASRNDCGGPMYLRVDRLRASATLCARTPNAPATVVALAPLAPIKVPAGEAASERDPASANR